MNLTSFPLNLAIVEGIDKDEDLVNLLKDLGHKYILIAGTKSYDVVGRKVEEFIRGASKKFMLVMNEGRAKLAYADTIISKCAEIDVVIGIGGGSNIDLAKYVAAKCQSKLVVIPTLLSTNAIASPYSVFYKDDKSIITVRTKRPELLVADMSVLVNQPERYALSGLGDLLAKITSLFDYRLSHLIAGDPFNKVAYEFAQASLDMTIKNVKILSSLRREGLELLLYLLVLDGLIMEIAKTTRIVAGCEHQIAYSLEKFSRGTHGENVALGILICSYIQGHDYGKVKNLLYTSRLPTSYTNLGMTRDNFVEALLEAHKTREWYTILGLRGFKDRNIVEEMLKDLEMN